MQSDPDLIDALIVLRPTSLRLGVYNLGVGDVRSIEVHGGLSRGLSRTWLLVNEVGVVECLGVVTGPDRVKGQGKFDDLAVVQSKQACCAGCRRRPFPMKLHQ